MEQYMFAVDDLITAHEDVITAKEDIIPKLTEKSLAQVDYVAELNAWIGVKNTIAGVKEDIAGFMEDKADRKSDIIDSKVDLNDLRLDLTEAKLNLEMAQMTGRSDLKTQQSKNSPLMLTEKETALDAKIKRDGELIDGQLGLAEYEAQIAYETMQDVNNIAIPSQLESLRAVGAYQIIAQRRTAEISAGAELTSSLIHLLK